MPRRLVATCIALSAGLAHAPAAAAQSSAEDSVTGTAATSNGLSASVDVRSGPSGENPHGTLVVDTPALPFDFVVVCLNVTGNTALVGANLPSGGRGAMFRFVDGTPDTISLAAFAGPVLPGDCTAPFTGPSPGNPFVSGNITVTDVRPLPTSKDQCENGGWRTYGVFKNQGDCVSFVATGGKNPPAHSP
jgi:hypothetical protein